MLRRSCLWLTAILLAVGPDPLFADQTQPPSDAAAPSQRAKDEEYLELFQMFAETLDEVERNYVKQVDRRKLVEAAVRGMVKELDQYSSYISPEDLTAFRDSVDSEFGGIGIQVSYDDGALTVVSPLVGTPAYKAGLRSGDRIVRIGQTPTEEITLSDAIKLIKGKPGTAVKLGVVRATGGDAKAFSITREIIHVQTVLGDRRGPDDNWDYMYDDARHIGYVRLSAFSRETAAELRRALESLQKAQLNGLILDLRFNPGGLLSSAIEVSDLFLQQGLIVGTDGRNSKPRRWSAHKKGTFAGFPMVVLVNRYSASASEIVAACLQDHGRAVVIGERTWGKGSVQNIIELEDGRSALKLTTSSYQRPSGKPIHRFPDATDWGVSPDRGYEVQLDNAEISRYLRYRRDRDIIQTGSPTAKAAVPLPQVGAPPEPADQIASLPEFQDRQLNKALAYLNGELAAAK